MSDLIEHNQLLPEERTRIQYALQYQNWGTVDWHNHISITRRLNQLVQSHMSTSDVCALAIRLKHGEYGFRAVECEFRVVMIRDGETIILAN